MLNERQQKLVDALESGEYKHGRILMHQVFGDEDEFCVLGVACDIYQKEVSDLNVTNHQQGMNFFRYDGESYQLPEKVKNYFGFRTPNGEFFQGKTHISQLTGLNDTGSTFKELAKIIKSKPRGLFTDA